MAKGKSFYSSFAILIISLATLGFSAFGIHNNLTTYKQSAVEAKLAQDKADKAKAAYMAKDEKVNKDAMTKALDSNDPILKSVATQNFNYARVKSVSTEFFKTYYTFANTSDYLARKDKLSGLITPDLANNKSIFDDGKDSTGNDYIKTLGVQSEFVKASAFMTMRDGGKAQALVRVENRAWYKGQQQQSGIATHYYNLTLDAKNNKITNLKLMLTVNGQRSNYNDDQE